MSAPEVMSRRAAGLPGAAWLRTMMHAIKASDGSGVVSGRDLRLDMFRGIALVMIFINHVPGTVYENFTSRNFGFSDAAESFVFMSGLAAGLAYSNRFRAGSLWAACAKVWARARQLYFVHITITMLCLAIFAGAAKWFGLGEVLAKNNIAPLFQQPLSTLIGIPLLTHQLGYLNILPLYMSLLLVTPLVLLIGLRKPWVMLAVSVLLWIAAGQFRLNLPNFPTQGGWFFNPFSWQILFVVGLLSGAAMKVGRAFIPFHPALFGAATAIVLVILLWVKVPEVGKAGMDGLSVLRDAGTPFYLTNFDKTYLSFPRLLHAFALFYMLGHLPLMRWVAGSPIAAPFRLLGRQGLAVFATGTVLSMALQVIKTPREADPLFDGLLLGCGLVGLLALAWVLTRTQELSRPAKSA